MRDLLDLTESMLVDEVPAEYRAEFREQINPTEPEPQLVTSEAPEARRDRIRHLSLITGGDVIEDGEA